MKKLLIAAAAALALAGCSDPDATGWHTPLDEGACDHQPNACAQGNTGGDADAFVNFYLGAITDPAELNPPGSYVPGTSPLEEMLGG